MNMTNQLHHAIQVGLLPQVKKLVHEGANMDCVLGMRGTALCASIEARSFQIAHFLLEAGCDVNIHDFDGEPPLLLAIRKESPGQICGRLPHLEIVKLLINHQKCNLNKVDPLTMKCAIHFATEQNMPQVVSWLINSESKTVCDVNQIDVNANSPLHLAVLEGLSEIVELLVSHPKCLIKVYNKAGLTPLHICARNGDIANMLCLLKKVSNSSQSRNFQRQLECEMFTESDLDSTLNAETIFEKETCLHIASRLGHTKVVELLLDFSAKVDIRDNLNNTPLLVTLASTPHHQTKDNDIPQRLLQKGANPNIRSSNLRCRYIEPNQEVTPLLLAAKNNNLELAKMLLSNGADVNLTDNMGQTPLYIALWDNALPVARFFLRECVNLNLNIQTNQGSTCLHALVKCRKNNNPDMVREIVKAIIQAGGQIFANKSNKTVLDKAFEYEDHVLFDAVVEELGTNLDDIRFVNSDQSADDVPILQRWIHKASSEGLIEMMQVLLCHGGDIDSTYFEYEAERYLSSLYIALYNAEYKMAQYLVINGADLRKEAYIFTDVEKKLRPDVIMNNDFNNRNNDDESDDDDGSDDYDSDEGDVFHGNEKFRKWLREVASTPRSLQLSSLVMIRKFFMHNKIPFKKMEGLQIPMKLINLLRYRV